MVAGCWLLADEGDVQLTLTIVIMARKDTVITCSTATLIICIALSTGLQIKPNVRKLFVGIGNSQTLECSEEKESPGAKILWEAPSTAVYKISTESEDQVNYYMLTIDSFSENDVGNYTCKFSSGGSASETKIELLTVKEKKIEGEFIFANKSDSAVLQCTLEIPSPGVKANFKEWLRNDITILNSKNYTDLKNGTLVISSPTRNEADLYVARFELADQNTPPYDCKVEYTAAPLVLDMAKSKNIVEGETLHLECSVKGYPHGNITWLRNGETIVVDQERIETESYKGYEAAKLIIKNMKSIDEGNYTCKATDDWGRTSSKWIHVRVKDELEWLWPIIGILCEAAVLTVIILICNKIKKSDHEEKPADEREGLLRQGSGRNREHN